MTDWARGCLCTEGNDPAVARTAVRTCAVHGEHATHSAVTQGGAGTRASLPEVTDVQRYRHQLGDKIIVTCPERISMDAAVRLRRIVSEVLVMPVDDVLVLADGVRIEVVETAQ